VLKSTHRYLLWCPKCFFSIELPEDVVFAKSRSRVTHCSNCGTKYKKEEILKKCSNRDYDNTLSDKEIVKIAGEIGDSFLPLPDTSEIISVH
jgi:uncharacterized Zn finger protein